MNILITGGLGLIGRNLVSELSKNNNLNIFLISRKNKIENTNSNIKYIFHDLSKSLPIEKIPKKINIIIHLAAIAHNPNGNVMKTNCLITKNLVRAFTNQKVKFIFFSSVAVYGEANRKFPIKTTDYCKPYTSYGIGKLKDEIIVSSCFEDYVILRVCPVIEGNEKDLLKRVYFPKTNIKYRSPYKRVYSFTSHVTIFNTICDIINEDEIKKITINLKDSLNYTESDILNKYAGKEIKIPLLICEPMFFILNLFSFLPKIYKINCLLTKMLKNNTYE